MKLSLVVPCFNEEENIGPFYDACAAAFSGKISDYELVLVNDGSRDGTWARMCALQDAHPEAHLRLVNFSRNFGKEAAMYAGLRRADADYVTIIDADLQQRPELAAEMVAFLDAHPEYDCVAAYQKERSESGLLKFCKSAFYKLINQISEVRFYPGASDFRTMRKKMARTVASLTESNRFSKGLLSWVGYQTYYLPYVAEQRNAGVSTWSFRKLFKYALEGIVAFTTFPLKIALPLGTALFGVSFVYLLVAGILALCGTALPGLLNLAAVVVLLGGLQLQAIGIASVYLSKIYTEAKDRPIYVAKDDLSDGKEL